METKPREHTELLTESLNNVPKVTSNGTGIRTESREPPDGGCIAITVLIASFLTNGLIFGIINTYSAIYTVYKDKSEKGEIENGDIKASLVGVLTIGTTFLLSPVSGILTGFLGLRLTAVLGGVVAATGLLISSFVVNNLDALCFTYGILYGLGASLAYTPSLAILGQYFKKYLGIANGIVTVGSSVFSVFIYPLLGVMIKKYGLEWTFRLLACFGVCIALCGLMFLPVPVIVIEKPKKEKFTLKTLLKSTKCVDMFKMKKYRLWALFMPAALFGYFVPYVHIKEFMKELEIADANLNLPLQCIVIASAVGRLTFGYLGDRKRIDNIFLQQISFYAIGTLTIILAFVKSYALIIVIALGMGLFEGAFISLIGPIAFELVGSANAAQGIGCMLGIAAIPLSIGPPVASAIHKKYGNYTLAFVLAGISPLIGATLMFLIRRQSTGSRASESNGHAITFTKRDAEKASTESFTANEQAHL